MVNAERIKADPSLERLGTAANVVTGIRTVASTGVAGWAAYDRSLTLLLAALGIYWLGDMLDGIVARTFNCETRVGAVMDILCDRLCSGAFYVGLIWLMPELTPGIVLFLVEFMVIDAFLTLAFLAWPIKSPNYFAAVDRSIYLWNWSPVAKVANSAVFAILLIVTESMWLGVLIGGALLIFKLYWLVRLIRFGLPIPGVAGPVS